MVSHKALSWRGYDYKCNQQPHAAMTSRVLLSSLQVITTGGICLGAGRLPNKSMVSHSIYRNWHHCVLDPLHLLHFDTIITEMGPCDFLIYSSFGQHSSWSSPVEEYITFKYKLILHTMILKGEMVVNTMVLIGQYIFYMCDSQLVKNGCLHLVLYEVMLNFECQKTVFFSELA